MTLRKVKQNSEFLVNLFIAYFFLPLTHDDRDRGKMLSTQYTVCVRAGETAHLAGNQQDMACALE